MGKKREYLKNIHDTIRDLERQVEYWKGAFETEQRCLIHEQHRAAALRGVITKLKKRIGHEKS